MLEELFPLSQQLMGYQNKPYVRYFLRQHNMDQRLIVVTGQRGVGKSTAMVQYLLQQADLYSSKILYVPCDHMRVRPYPIYDIAEQFVKEGGKHICFDEIHKYNNWSQELKNIYDSFPELQVLATGSCALSIHRGAYDLSRRALGYTMRGMSMREYMEMNYGLSLPTYEFLDILTDHVVIASKINETLAQHGIKILSEFQEYLQQGYYPYSIELKDKKIFYLTLEQNIDATLDSDLVAIHPNLNGVSIQKIKRLLAFIAKNVPFKINMVNLKEATEIRDERTLKQYLEYLEEAGILMLMYHGQAKLAALSKPDKIYFNNTNQLYAIANGGKDSKGTIREVFSASMLLQKHEVSIPNQGDFLVDEKTIIEIGGKNKDGSQIKKCNQAYVFADNIEIGYKQKIPLWLLGFLY